MSIGPTASAIPCTIVLNKFTPAAINDGTCSVKLLISVRMIFAIADTYSGNLAAIPFIMAIIKSNSRFTICGVYCTIEAITPINNCNSPSVNEGTHSTRTSTNVNINALTAFPIAGAL